MPVNYQNIGKRIKHYRTKASLTQEDLAERIHISRKHLSLIEVGNGNPSIDTLVDIANQLKISADNFILDSLEHSVSTADSEIHDLLLDCNDIEEKVLVRMVKELKAILYGLGI